uniref:Ceramide kinase n=1 Tax=Myripristis murdjan TaxID=586833 RepID=A0A667Z420_9TELE
AVSEIVAVTQGDAASGRHRNDGRWQKMSPRTEERTRQHRWRCSEVTFQCPEGALCRLWVSSITEQLQALAGRPKRLLVYINPFGGKQQGRRVYEQKVSPLFARAGIATHVIAWCVWGGTACSARWCTGWCGGRRATPAWTTTARRRSFSPAG